MDNMEERQVEQCKDMKNTEKKEGKDMENMAENSKKIWKIRKKGKLNNEKI